MARNEPGYRWLRRPSHDLGGPSHDLVARFLNEEPDGSARAEALEIFELCRQLDALRKEWGDESSMMAPERLAERIGANNSRAISLRKKLNTALRKLQFVPQLVGYPSYSVIWAEAPFPAPEPTISAGSIVQEILEALEQGTLDRIRQCLCGKWFFAQTNKKTVCSDACRFRKFKQANPDFTKQRARYMRKYRKNPVVRKRKTHAKKTK